MMRTFVTGVQSGTVAGIGHQPAVRVQQCSRTAAVHELLPGYDTLSFMAEGKDRDPRLQSVYCPGIPDPATLEIRRERGIDRYYDLNEDGIQDVYFHTGTLPSPTNPGVVYHNITAGNSSQRSLQNGTSGLLQWQFNINRVWNDRLYLRPIAASDLVVNPKLGQNPGW